MVFGGCRSADSLLKHRLQENSEEMTSLDNDSFLNSLEAVTIQNYWADATKNTNV